MAWGWHGSAAAACLRHPGGEGAPLSCQEGICEQAGGLPERWVATWAAASPGTMTMLPCSKMEGPITLGGLQRLQQLAQPASAVRCLRAREHEAERCRVAALCREQQRTPALRGSRPRVGFGLEQQRRALRAVVRRRGREDGQHEWRPPARICLRQQRRRGGEQRARDVGMPAQSGKV